MRTMCGALAIAFVFCVAAALGDQTQPHLALMTKGKLEADLGNYSKAAEAFASVANDTAVPATVRSEALVRLGLARSAAGDTPGSLEAFRTVLERYSTDRSAIRFATGALAAGVPGKIWGDFKNELEQLLRTAEIASVIDVGMAKASKIVRLKWDTFELRTVWRPSELGREPATSPSHSRELAAYEIDKMLGLDMVPPTVAREIEGHSGAIQFWVNGVRVYEGAQQIPNEHNWSRQLSRMQLFDALLGNAGRNLNNMLVDRNDNLTLIDFMEAFSNDRTLEDLPQRFDRRLVEKLRALDSPQSRVHLKSILSDDEIETLLARKDALLAHMQKLIAERGETAVLF